MKEATLDEEAEGEGVGADYAVVGYRYSVAELLRLRQASDKSCVDFGLHLEDVPPEESSAAGPRDRRNARPKRGPIGPITECVPIDAEVLQSRRGELRRIEAETGAQIREKAGLRNYTVMITGTSSIVERALPLVEQALLLSEGPAPSARSFPEPPVEPPPQKPSVVASSKPAADSVADEEWEIPPYWRQAGRGEGLWGETRGASAEPEVPVGRATQAGTAVAAAATVACGGWSTTSAPDGVPVPSLPVEQPAPPLAAPPAAAPPADGPPAAATAASPHAASPAVAPPVAAPPAAPAGPGLLAAPAPTQLPETAPVQKGVLPAQEAPSLPATPAGVLPGRWRQSRPAVPEPQLEQGPLEDAAHPPLPEEHPPALDCPDAESQPSRGLSQPSRGLPPPEELPPALAAFSDVERMQPTHRPPPPEAPLDDEADVPAELTYLEAQEADVPVAELDDWSGGAADDWSWGPAAAAEDVALEDNSAVQATAEPDDAQDDGADDGNVAPGEAGDAAKKKKKPKKKKKKADEPTKDVAKAEAKSAPRPEAKPLKQHFSKTAFSGLEGSSESEAEPESPSKPAKEAESKAAKAAPKPAAQQRSPSKAGPPPVPPAATPASPSKRPPNPPAPEPAPPPVKLAHVAKQPPPVVAKPAPAPLTMPAAWGAEERRVPPAPTRQPPPPPAPKPPPVLGPPAVEQVEPQVLTPPAASTPSRQPPPPKQSTKAKPPEPKGMNPLPQRAVPAVRAAKAPRVLSGGLAVASSDSNAATSQKWLERPVEKLALQSTRYEEEEDPELACYLWDRKAQRPKNDQVRVGPKQAAPVAPAPAAAASQARVPPPPPQRQRQLLGQVMEMGFDEPTAKRALTSTGWAGVNEAVAALLGS